MYILQIKVTNHRLCKSKDGTRLSKSSYYAMQSALFHLYRIFGKTQSNKFQKELTTLFKGFLRTLAQEVQNGRGKISTGKIPGFRMLYKYFLLT